ncbi:50S ribosomal protein L25 [Candidatus Dojkabacteria bacterium]|uniref:Large ribosomal subunit protein bL25 n=1 Tax=Candidatus Dojkabacteria bacterium TaxID=2099670 RepID=A0A952ALU7_9BACT|nr:50S ribosomal protein L25 [Candidatus Dojkabacteria bacterium]
MKLNVSSRKVSGKKVKHLRKEGKIPGSVYGPKTEPISFEIDAKVFNKLFDKVGYSNLIDLSVDDKKSGRALVKEVQTDPLSQEVISVSLYQVDMTKPIMADIPVVITGESPAVKNNLGLLVNQVDELTVYCLPDDLPSEFVVDISKLEQVGDSIHAKDIELPKGVELDAADLESSVIAYIAAPQKTLEEEATETEGEVAEGEGVEAAPAEETAKAES